MVDEFRAKGLHVAPVLNAGEWDIQPHCFRCQNFLMPSPERQRHRSVAVRNDGADRTAQLAALQ
jgi:hypothetical protein